MKQIDYNNIFNHCDAQLVGNEIHLEEKETNDFILKFDIEKKSTENDQQFFKRFGDYYCDFVRKTKNRVIIKDWFRNKYK